MIATCPLTYTRPPATVPIARRIASVRSAAGCGSSVVSSCAKVRFGPAGCSGPTRAWGRAAAARVSAAVCAAGGMAPENTIVKAESGR